MSYVILNLAQTIDGLICRPDGTVDFLPEFDGEVSTDFREFLKRIDVIIMGRQTYEEYKSYGYEMYGDVKIYVWTTRPKDNTKNITFYTGEIVDLVKKNKGKNIWCFGGTRVITEFINHDLIDEFQITTVPYLLGDGKPLFKDINKEFDLELISLKNNHNMVTSIYRRKR